MRLSPAAWVVSALAAAVALWVRLHDVFTYPIDWGFDASFNWQYIYNLTLHWRLPPPDVGWSTGDPPLFFYVSAALLRAFGSKLVIVPLLNVAVGFGVAALAAGLVRRAAPDDPLRAALAFGLLLYLPAHVHMSVMVNEEMIATGFASLALFAVARPGVVAERGVGRAAAAGLAAGLALLTKLTGSLAVLAASAAYAVDGLRGRRPGPAALRIAVLGAVATAAGGWFFLRNRLLYGYFQPFGLPAHEIMFSMPPGEREWLDYLRFPLATFTDPQLLNPDLLRSVWGSTYASVWYDAHRSFLPTHSVGVARLGTLTLTLALLPTAAFAAGVARGARRLWRGDGGLDAPLLAMVALTFAGYAFYTWQNPWFAVLKGTSLLALSLPYAFYTSEMLLLWSRRRRGAALAIGALLAALAVCVTISCTFNGLFERTEVSGFQWERQTGR